jgi:hypothetical protein
MIDTLSEKMESACHVEIRSGFTFEGDHEFKHCYFVLWNYCICITFLHSRIFKVRQNIDEILNNLHVSSRGILSCDAV